MLASERSACRFSRPVLIYFAMRHTTSYSSMINMKDAGLQPFLVC